MRWTPVLVAVLLTPLAFAADNAEDAALLDYVLSVDDPKDDHSGPCPVAGCGSPGTYNKENDLLNIAVTDDPTTFVMRFKIQTCDFEVPTGFAFVNVEFGGALAGFEGTVAFEDGCTDLRAIHIDSVTTAAGSDPDKLLPGIRVFADPATATLYMMADYTDLGLNEGDSITFGRIHTGRQFTDPGRYTFGMDEATVSGFTVGSGWVVNAPTEEGPAPVERIVETMETTENLVSLAFANATKTVHIDWGLASGNGTIRVDIAGEGAVRLNATDANGDLLFALTGTQDDFSQDINVPVPLNVTLELDGFTGNVTMSFAPPGAPKPTATSTTSTSASSSTSQTQTTGNQTSGGATKAKESPGLPLAALLGAVVLAVLRRRQS